MPSIDTYIASALERLAERESQSARQARTRARSGDLAAKAEACFFQRARTAYTNALIEYKRGVRPEQLDSGAWLLPSRRPDEPPHIVRMDGDWICTCKAAGMMHWPIALIVGIEVAHDDMERLDGDDEGEAATCTPDDPCSADAPCPGHAELAAQVHAAGVGTAFDLATPPPPTPIVVAQAADGALTFSRGGITQFITDPADVAGAIAQLISGPVAGRAMGQRLARARARIAA